MSLPAGTRLDNYEIIRALGAGGMGEVWLAQDLHLGRKVALKLLPLALTTDPARVKRFEQEARAASALNHPNVCTIYALGQTSEARRFIAMEYVEGQTLRERLIRGRVARRERLDIAVQIASALTAAHAAGVVHRDLKPENVILRTDGIVKVLDFGLAKLVGSDPALATRTVVQTEAGAIVGTVLYMSPEQARGVAVDARTDVWSLGVVLYELVAGRPPFEGASTSEVLAGILEHEPAPLSRFEADASAELQRIVGKTLRKDPDQRYQVMKDLLLDLQALRNEIASGSGAASPPSRPARTVTTSERTLAVALGAAILIAGLIVGTWWARHGQPTNTKTAEPATPVDRPLTRLTFDSGLQTDVTFSPDGQSIAFASDRTGNFDIWVQSLAGGDARRLTMSPAEDTQPAWSPDGRRIVFRSEREGGGLFIVPVHGGSDRQLKQLTSLGTNPQWTANGSEILFRTGSTGQHSYVSLISSDGADPPRHLLQDFLVGGWWHWIAPHPDGRVSAFGVHRTRGFGFFTVSPDSLSVTSSKFAADLPLRLSEGVARFQWSPDGSSLYVEAVMNEVQNIWKIRVEPATLEWRSAERLTTGAGADVAAALSRDGKRIAYTAQRESVRLWAFPFDAAAGRIVGKRAPVTPAEGKAGSFSLSPDGRMVAYPLTQAGTGRVDLWMTNIDTGKSEVIAENATASGAWSADSKAIAYQLRRAGSPAPGEYAAFVRQVGGSERPLTRWSKNLFWPFDWTHDGQAIIGLFTAPVTLPKLVVWRPSTPPAAAPERILLDDPQRRFWQATFSPNGRWLSFVAQPVDDKPYLEMGLSSADRSPGDAWRRIIAEHIRPDKPRWAPDGRTLYFISDHKSLYNLWGIRFDPDRGVVVGEPFMVTRFDSPGFRMPADVGSFELGIAARRAVLTMSSVSGNIWMLENVDR